jgi:predicted PurR-regulated permease PerM
VTEDTPGPARPNPLDAIPVDWIIRIGCLAILVYWAFLLILPFLTIMVWSVILAVTLYPVFDWAVSRLRLWPGLAAILITVASLLVIVGPATWLGISLIGSLRYIFEQFDASLLAIPPPPETIKTWPLVGEGLYQIWQLASTNLTAALTELGPHLKPIGTTLLGIAGSAGLDAIKFMTAVAVSGLLFVPGPALVDTFRSIVSHIVTKRGEEFVNLAGATIRNLARGVIGIAMLQALLTGLGLIVAAVPAAGLISFLVLVCGIVQIGASVVIGPLVIWSWLTMSTSHALLFSAYMIPVALVDNVLRPLVFSRGLKTPMPVILMGVIGGILTHGMIGLFIGPVVLAIGWELLRAWMREEAAEVQPQP